MELDLKRYRNRHSFKSKFARMAWEVIWLLLFRPTPRWCLNGWRCFLLRLFGAKMGKGVRIQGSVKVWQPCRLRIGCHSWIGDGASLYSVDDITIGENAVVSEGAFICTASRSASERLSRPVQSSRRTSRLGRLSAEIRRSSSKSGC